MATKIKETKDKLELSSANMDRAASELENMDYDVFKQGAGYEGLKKNYEQQGRVAMQDTIGQVAARTGGMASSYAQTAGQQSYNNYMKTLEDAARSMFEADRQQKMNEFSIASSIYDRDNDAYRDAVADQRYDTEWAYQKERDALADQRYNTEWDYKIGQEEKAADEERIYTDIYYGGASDYNAYKDKGGKLTQAEYESIVRSAQGARSDDTYSRDQAAKEQAQADVMAIWASGGTPTPEQLEAAGWYNDTVANDATDMTADNDGDGYPDNLSELGRAYYSQTEIDNYRYPATADGANSILNDMINSASMELGVKHQKNFDYIYGEGAYEAVQDFISEIARIHPPAGPRDEERSWDEYKALEDRLTDKFPGFSLEQLDSLLYAVNPDLYNGLFKKGS